MPASPIAVIAGEGDLPLRVIEACEAAGRRVVVCGVVGHDGDLPRNDRPLRLETLGSLIAELRAGGVSEVCICGSVKRPAIDPAEVDAATAPMVERMIGALRAGGDDTALRVLISLLEQGGLHARAATDLVPDLLPPEGVPTSLRPTDAHGADAGRAAAVVAALGAVDVGQGCVVRRGEVLAVEAVLGTDWMLASLAEAPMDRPEGSGGLLYKAPKPRQERRADLPAIGPATVTWAARAGLEGIVIEAGGVMVLDWPGTVAAADIAGLFLWVRSPAPAPGLPPD